MCGPDQLSRGGRVDAQLHHSDKSWAMIPIIDDVQPDLMVIRDTEHTQDAFQTTIYELTRNDLF
jgi:hypothetical protein